MAEAESMTDGERAIQNEFEKGGIEAAVKKAKALLDWRDTNLNVAITGISGAGKSSFVNAVRGLKANDSGAAAVGIKKTTIKSIPYSHPKNEKLRILDIPGVGTLEFTRENYLQKVEFNKYDFYIILSADRFTEDDLWLGKQIKEAGKDFFFVRTKVDVSIDNEE